MLQGEEDCQPGHPAPLHTLPGVHPAQHQQCSYCTVLYCTVPAQCTVSDSVEPLSSSRNLKGLNGLNSIKGLNGLNSIKGLNGS